MLDKTSGERLTNGHGTHADTAEEEEEAARAMAGVRLGAEDSTVTNKLAVTSILHRFQAVLCNYIQDEQLSAPVPLPSHRVAELSFVLRALTTLISSLKRGGGGGGEVDSRTWAQVIGLYPHLVTATSIQTASVSSRLQEALHQYQGLLRPPTPVAGVNISINGESSS